MEYWLKSRISYDITPILHHSSTPRLIYAWTSGNPEFTSLLFIEPKKNIASGKAVRYGNA